jgi:hypothetical protein
MSITTSTNRDDRDWTTDAIDANWGIATSTDTTYISGEVNFSAETISKLRVALEYGDVIVKCGACGQWGAVKTACKHCGHPIDPASG